MTHGELMAAEIAEQPAALARLLADGATATKDVRAAIERHDTRFVLFAARGTSDHAALYAKYLVEIELGLPAGLASASTMTVYGARPQMRGVLWIAVSQSGGSPDLVRSTEIARAGGALTVAVTNDPSSELARVAEYSVDVHAGPERAVAATKTYTAELLALHQLLLGTDAAAVPDACARTLDFGDRAAAAAPPLLSVDRLVTVGRGYSYATAREGALKLMETSYLMAQAFSGADLLHGPLAMVSPEVPVLAVTTPGHGAEALLPVLAALEERHASVLRIGPEDGLPVVLDGVPESLAPVVEILPLQQLAWRLALDRGSDPDAPGGLSKVTQTW